MTPEEYWAYKTFIRDDAADEALRKSEVFQNYKQAEIKREAELKCINLAQKEQEEADALKSFDEFEKAVNASPVLKQKLKEVKAYIAANPQAEEKMDQKLLAGLNMLNIED